MLANAQAAYVYVGVLPPTNPDATTLWLSTSLQDLRAPNGIGDRTAIIAPTQAWEGAICQEPTVWYNTSTALWSMIYTGGNSGSPRLGYATAPTPLGPWTKYASNPVLGGGGSSYANGVFHSDIYIEGSTMYCYFVDNTAQTKFKVATASLSSPTAWTVVGDVMTTPGSTAGNMCLVKEGASSYTFFHEDLSSGWQMGIATGTSPLGPFTNVQFPMSALWPDSHHQQASGPFCFLENGTYVMYYHAGLTNLSLPTDIYRAKSIDKVNWTVDLNGFPLIKRMAPQEVDQVADVALCQGPNEGWWAFWTAYDNDKAASSIMCAPMYPTMKRWDGYAWANIESVCSADAALDYIAVETQTAAYTAKAREDVPMDATAGNLVVTLPYASIGSFCRFSHVGTGANTVTPALQGSDVVLGSAISLTTGQTATLKSFIQGKWSRVS